MKILMVWARFLPETGGIETHIHEIGRRLIARGHEVTVLATDRTGTLPAASDISGLRVVRVRAWPRNKDIYFAPGVFARILSERWDVVHVQGYHTLVAPFAMLAAILARRDYVVTFHSGGHSSALRTAIRGAQWRALAPLVRRARRLIGVSRFEARHFSAAMNIAPERFSVIYNGSEIAAAHSPDRRSAEGDVIVSIGRLERYKGFHRVIEAFSHLLVQRPEAELHIIGDGPYREQLTRLTAALGLEDRVRISAHDPADRDGLARRVARASLVVLLSDYEAHPVAVMEALGLGRPVLANHCSGFVELADKGWIETVSPRAHPAEVAEVMRRMIDAPPRARPKLPTWDEAADEIEQVYMQVRHA